MAKEFKHKKEAKKPKKAKASSGDKGSSVNDKHGISGFTKMPAEGVPGKGK